MGTAMDVEPSRSKRAAEAEMERARSSPAPADSLVESKYFALGCTAVEVWLAQLISSEENPFEASEDDDDDDAELQVRRCDVNVTVIEFRITPNCHIGCLGSSTSSCPKEEGERNSG